MEDRTAGILITLGILLALGCIPGAAYGCPKWNVWRAGQEGEAELRRADQNRHIKVLEAQAELDSAKLKAQSEVERAKGVAEANKIVADGLKGHDEYLRYLWIDKVAGGAGTKEIIYVPTEASMPILEAGRFAEDQ